MYSKYGHDYTALLKTLIKIISCDTKLRYINTINQVTRKARVNESGNWISRQIDTLKPSEVQS